MASPQPPPRPDDSISRHGEQPQQVQQVSPSVGRFARLPLELDFLILSFLDPPSLLSMSSTSRAWARILRRPGDHSAMKLWVQARLNVEMPELESDLRAGVDIDKEVLLAKLIDREICQECDAQADELWDVDFDVRVRLCVECWPKLMRSESRIIEEIPGLHPLVFASSLYTADQDWSEVDEDDDSNYKYFVPDVIKESAHLHELEAFNLCAPSGALTPAMWHVSKREAFTKKARRDANVLMDWWRAEKKRRAVKDLGGSALALAPDEAEHDALQRRGSTRRQHAAYYELEKLGCPETEYKDFFMSYGRRFYASTPSLSSGKSESKSAHDVREDYNFEIDRFCDNTEPLDDYEWEEHKKRVTLWVAERQQRYANIEAQAHRQAQREAVSPLHNLVARCLGPEMGALLCPLDVFLKFPAVRALWAPAGATVQHQQLAAALPYAILRAAEVVREDRLVLFNRIARNLLAEGDPLPPSILHALTTVPSPFIDYDPLVGIEPAYLAIPPADVDLVLGRATALLRCGRCSILAPVDRLIKHMYDSISSRVKLWAFVAPAETRALIRGAAGAAASRADCELIGRRWEISGGCGVDSWMLTALEWTEVLQTKLTDVDRLALGPKLPHALADGPRAHKVLGTLLLGRISPEFMGWDYCVGAGRAA